MEGAQIHAAGKFGSHFPFKRVMVLSESEADLEAKGFCTSQPDRLAHLSQIALHFVRGYNAMLEPEPLATLDALLTKADPVRHGFLVEGAAMGSAVRDALTFRGRWLRNLTERHGQRFEYLMAVGAGWAMARTPWRVKRIANNFDPLLTGLSLDGRGFHDVFFNAQKAERGQIQRFSGSNAQAYDNGVGRALWFVAGGDPFQLLAILERFAPERYPSLLAGVGLAMGYAGPSTAADWTILRAAHEQQLIWMGQGLAFAAEAMNCSGEIPEGTERTCQMALGISAKQLAQIAKSTRPVAHGDNISAYRSWQSAIVREISEKV